MLILQLATQVIRVESSGVATLVLAVTAVVLALFSLGWQILEFWFGGPRIKVKLVVGYANEQGDLVKGPPNADSEKILASQGFTTKLLGVEVTNRGRMPISIVDVRAKMECGAAYIAGPDRFSPAPGHRVEPHSTENWFIDWADLQGVVRGVVATMEMQRDHQETWMIVSTGTGKDVRTKKTITIQAD